VTAVLFLLLGPGNLLASGKEPDYVSMILGGFGGRSGSARQKLLMEGGGNARSEAAVAQGLRWLALHQADDGHWGLHDFHKHARTEPLPKGKVAGDNCRPETTRKNDVAGTAFGLLPFLAAGITPKKPARKVGVDYSGVVKAGLNYLVGKQNKKGDARGAFGDDLIGHALATIAMCEAYALTSDPTLKTSAQLAISYILATQHLDSGGWGDRPKTLGNMEATGWHLMALKSAQMAGLSVDRKALKRVEKFLDSCESSGANRGRYSSKPGGSSALTPTAVAALCRLYLGSNPRNLSLQGSIKWIRQSPPRPGSKNVDYEYHATQVMHHMGGDAWQFWNLGPKGDGKGGMRDTLITRQNTGAGKWAAEKGSFAASGHPGGRLAATSLSLLSLEVYYRYLPLYRRDLAPKNGGP
jgi:hypothetical protein